MDFDSLTALETSRIPSLARQANVAKSFHNFASGLSLIQKQNCERRYLVSAFAVYLVQFYIIDHDDWPI